MAAHRTERVNEEIKKEVSEIIRELKDPRIPQMTSVTSVDTTRDLRYCKIFVSVLGDEAQFSQAVACLNNAAGFVRKEIGARMDLRYAPEITFVADTSIVYGAHISKILQKIEDDQK